VKCNILDKLVEVEMIEFYKELKKNAKKSENKKRGLIIY